MNKTIINDRTGFEVYLEGVKAQPASITIRENEGGFPNANLSYPATSAIFRILPGTVVQIFGPDPLTNEKILLFEGEIKAVSYQKSGTSRSASFSCKSFLNDWTTVQTRAKDSLAPPEYFYAEGGKTKIWKYKNLTQEDENKQPAKPTKYLSNLPDDIKKKINNEVSGDLNTLVDDLDLTNFARFADDFSQLLRRDSISKGDIHLFMQFFLRKFEENSPYYGMTANSYGIANSVLGFPNKDKIDPFKKQAVLDNTMALLQDIQNPFTTSGLNLFTAIRQMLQTFQYTLIAPAHFTGSYRFWTNNYTKIKPVRSYLTPNLENSPPAKFNLFFPHQVSSVSFNRSFEKEATRTIGELQLPIEMLGDVGLAGSIKGVSGFATEPNLNITSSGVGKNQVGFTPEETYRGIQLNKASISRFFTEALNDKLEEVNANEKSIDKDTSETIFEGAKPAINQLTLESHIRQRLNARTVNIQATWSPYRMTGVPAAFIEDGDGPSITGVISSISTNITANGRVSSTITLRSPRMVPTKEDVLSADDEELMNEFELDPYVDTIEYLFDPNIYSFTEIGKSIYTYLRKGKLHATQDTPSKFKEYSKDDVFADFTNALERLSSEDYASSEDSSIIDFIRSKEGNPETSLGANLELSRGSQYTRSVYESIYALRDLYKSFDDKDNFIDKWTNELTHRNIISKREYFNSISITNPESETNCKNAMKLFLGTEGMDNIKTQMFITPKETSESQTLTEDEVLAKTRELKSHMSDISEIKGYLESPLLEVSSFSKAKLIEIEKWSESAPPDGSLSSLGLREVKIETLEWALETLETRKSKLIKELQDNGVSDPEKQTEGVEAFEYELFKPYNLTRRRHVLTAVKKLTKQTLKAENEEGSSDVRQNLTILK